MAFALNAPVSDDNPQPIRGVTAICKGYQQITGLNTVKALTVPSGATFAVIQAETQNVRWTDDASTPSATVGMIFVANTAYTYDGDLDALQFIETTASAKLNVTYYA